MSTVQATNLKHNASASNNIVLDSSGNATFANNVTASGNVTSTGMVVPSSSFLRNRIINGDMRIDQRYNGAASTTIGDGYETVDRYRSIFTGASKFTLQQNLNSVTPPAGFTNYLGVKVNTAITSLAANDIHTMCQFIEGLNVADFSWGTSSAVAVTLSFWVRSTNTGTFGGALQNSAQNRSYPFTYSISAANTWEYKTITISGETTGTWVTNNGVGVRIVWSLGSGTSVSGTAGAWAASDFRSATGATSIMGSTSNTWFLTGVQLEVGTVATPFERRQYGQELALCQRYFQAYPNPITYRANPSGGSFTMRQTAVFAVPMRAAPSVTVTTSAIGNQAASTNVIGAFATLAQFEATTPNSTAWGNPHYDVAFTASAEL